MSSYTWIFNLILGAMLLWQAFALAKPPKPMTLIVPPARPAARIGFVVAFAIVGLLVLVAIKVVFLGFFAACFGAALLGLALVFSARRPELSSAALVAVPIALCAAIAIAQPLGLKVLMLPKAAQLPYSPMTSTVVKTYGEGVSFEGIAADSDGTIYLTANRDLDFSDTDYCRRCHGVLIERLPNGREREMFKTRVGSTIGMVAVASSGDLYVTSYGNTSGIWRVSRDAKAQLIAALASGAWPNGIAFGPDGLLYVADSNLGAVWRIDPKIPRPEQAIVDSRLRARPFVSLAPGANGIAFRGQDLVVTVSDTTQVLAFARRHDGSFDSPRTLATGIPGDDFAIAANGDIFITTHPYDTVVRLAPNGRRTVVGDARQSVVGATAAAFGRTANDRETLYVVTDGGAFTGAPATRGRLVALSVR